MGNEFTGSLDALSTVAHVTKVNDNWVSGSIDGHTFEAKIFAENSCFGIQGGRISKLQIKKNGKTALNYDRGWDVKPLFPATSILEKLLNALS